MVFLWEKIESTLIKNKKKYSILSLRDSTIVCASAYSLFSKNMLKYAFFHLAY